MLGACTTWRPVPPVVPLPSDAAFAWPSVLDQAVDAGGRVDFQRLAAIHGALDIAVAAIAQADLASMPGRAERLAFLVNASNTLWVYAVVRGGIPGRLGPLDRADLLRLSRFDVAGQERTLDSLQRDVILPLADGPGGWRVPLALYCPAVSCPRLARTPYAAAGLDAALEAAARRFLSDPANVILDPAARIVRVSALMTPAVGLLATLNRHRTTPIPVDYRVEPLPFDWTLAQVP